MESLQESRFDCNICLEACQEQVITPCGHLYCWPCIYSWLHSNQEYLSCPVCKNGLQLSQVVPIYTREDTGSLQDNPNPNRNHNIPPRPQVQRQQPTRNNNIPNSQGGLNIPNGSILAGYGYFPSLFNLLFQVGNTIKYQPESLHQSPELKSQWIFKLLQIILLLALLATIIVTF